MQEQVKVKKDHNHQENETLGKKAGTSGREVQRHRDTQTKYTKEGRMKRDR